MFHSSNMQTSSQKKVQQWKTDNSFHQTRHGEKQDSFAPETILVGLRRDEENFELLSWAINVAARPGDVIIAFHLNYIGAKVENLIGKLQTESLQEQEAAHTQLGSLKELCELKKIQMDVRFSLSGNEELELIEEASAVLATMLVIRPPSRQVLWNAQRKGSFLARKVPSGCSIVIVKGFKVLYYKDNAFSIRDSHENSSALSNIDSHLGTPICKPRGACQALGSLQRQFSCTSSPMWRREDEDDLLDSDRNVVTSNKVWPLLKDDGSPRGVLDSSGSLSDSDISSPSSTHITFSRSLSRKGLLSCVSPQDDVVPENNCLSMWRNGSIKRSTTFPPASRLKKFSGPLDYSSMRNSFKSYVNTLWGTDSMRHEEEPPTSSDAQQNWRCFFYEELAFATNDFNPANLVGKGGHAEVYKGTLVDGRVVAIKCLKKGGSEEVKERDFLTELGIIGHVSHPNTTPLIGFCVEEGLHLIFDFSSNGSLASWLHGSSAPALEWSARYKAAVGTARGLHYLHTACPRRIIHRDIKASNILLGPDFEAQISDFGLAKWLPEQWTQLSVFPVEGTFGYLAPEYFMHGIIHEKTDVFAYGVLLLELITGRLPIDKSQQSLVMWAKPLLESSKIEELADPSLEGAYDHQEMQAMVLAAGLCVQSSPICRPHMGQVLDLLTDEHSESFSIPSSQSDSFFDDSSEEYNSSTYLSDLSRHREIALQF